MSAGIIKHPHVVHAVVDALRGLGFVSTNRSKNSGSRYLRWPSSAFTLRISDHQWSGYLRRRHPNVVASRIVPAEVNRADLPGLALEIGIAFIFRSRLRLGLVGSVAA